MLRINLPFHNLTNQIGWPLQFQGQIRYLQNLCRVRKGIIIEHWIINCVNGTFLSPMYAFLLQGFCRRCTKRGDDFVCRPIVLIFLLFHLFCSIYSATGQCWGKNVFVIHWFLFANRKILTKRSWVINLRIKNEVLSKWNRLAFVLVLTSNIWIFGGMHFWFKEISLRLWTRFAVQILIWAELRFQNIFMISLLMINVQDVLRWQQKLGGSDRGQLVSMHDVSMLK